MKPPGTTVIGTTVCYWRVMRRSLHATGPNGLVDMGCST